MCGSVIPGSGEGQGTKELRECGRGRSSEGKEEWRMCGSVVPGSGGGRVHVPRS